MDDELAQDERRALDQRLVVDADLRSTSDAMAQLRMALGSLTADPPGDMLADFRRHLNERPTRVLDRPLQDSLRAMQSTLSTIQTRLGVGERRRRLRRLVEATDRLCPAHTAGEYA